MAIVLHYDLVEDAESIGRLGVVLLIVADCGVGFVVEVQGGGEGYFFGEALVATPE